MMRLKSIGALVAMVVLSLFQACTMIDDDRPTMERVRMTTEYLEVLGKYNAVSREFSKAVKPLQETEKRMDAPFNQEWWGHYDAQWAKTAVAITELKNYRYRFEPFKELIPDFRQFITRIEDYNSLVDKMRKSTPQWTADKRAECFKTLDPVYGDILKQSVTIVQKIDSIYNRVFVVGENKK